MSAAGFPAALFAVRNPASLPGTFAPPARAVASAGRAGIPVSPCQRTTLCVGLPMAFVSHEQIRLERANIFNWDILPTLQSDTAIGYWLPISALQGTFSTDDATGGEPAIRLKPREYSRGRKGHNTQPACEARPLATPGAYIHTRDPILGGPPMATACHKGNSP